MDAIANLGLPAGPASLIADTAPAPAEGQASPFLQLLAQLSHVNALPGQLPAPQAGNVARPAIAPTISTEAAAKDSESLPAEPHAAAPREDDQADEDPSPPGVPPQAPLPLPLLLLTPQPLATRQAPPSPPDQPAPSPPVAAAAAPVHTLGRLEQEHPLLVVKSYRETQQAVPVVTPPSEPTAVVEAPEIRPQPETPAPTAVQSIPRQAAQAVPAPVRPAPLRVQPAPQAPAATQPMVTISPTATPAPATAAPLPEAPAAGRASEPKSVVSADDTEVAAAPGPRVEARREQPAQHRSGGEEMAGNGDPAPPVFKLSAPAEAHAVAKNINFDSLVSQIARPQHLSRLQSVRELQIVLDPPALGPLTIQLSHAGGTITATVMTEQAPVHDLLQAHLAPLQNVLQGQGLNVDKVSVVLQPPAQGAATTDMSGGRRQEAQQPPERRRRNANLSLPSAPVSAREGAIDIHV